MLQKKKYQALYQALCSALEELDEASCGGVSSTVSYSGMRFAFSLKRQKEGTRYPLRGSVRALDSRSKTLQVETPSGEKRYARKSVEVPFPKQGPLSQAASELVCKQIIALYQEHNLNLKGSNLQNMDLLQLTLAQILLLYDKAYESQDARKVDRYHRQLKCIDAIAQELLDTPMSKIRRSILTAALPQGVGVETQLKYLRALEDFLSLVQAKARLADPLIPCIQGMVEELARENKHKTSKKKRIAAANAHHLPHEIEGKLNETISVNLMEGPRFLAMALIKGGCLPLKDSVELRLENLQLDENDPRIVFVTLRRQYAGSATQFYTFPLFPYEAILVNRYIHALGERSPARIEGDRFLLSEDEEGKVPMNTKGFSAFVRNILQTFRIGYAGLLGDMDLSQNHGIEILRNTYQHRLQEYCGISPQHDRGAYTFLQHLSLADQVQSDHYRSFTADCGPDRLLGLVWRDQRFIPPKPKQHQLLKSKQGDWDQITYRNKDVNSPQTITLTFTAPRDGIVRLSAPYGALFQGEYLGAIPKPEPTPKEQTPTPDEKPGSCA